MFAVTEDNVPGQQEFGRNVESIMRCEDFKSNFARKLSNRYISRSPVSSPKQDTALKLQPFDRKAESIAENVPERIELVSLLSRVEQNGEAVQPPDKMAMKNSDLRSTEVTVLNMEVETLRWQLAQTEVNRQMHIALLKQIVTFLNKVKEHIESQKDPEEKKDLVSGRLSAGSFSTADLPRSRSVVHVNKNIEYSLTSKKISTRKISKSISNVNGFKDSKRIWSRPKLSLSSETNASQKISEEMSRLITLANSVLCTKLPDLSPCNEDASNKFAFKFNDNINHIHKITHPALQLVEEEVQSNTTILNAINNGDYKSNCNDFIMKPPNLDGLDDGVKDMKINDDDHTASGTESEISTRKLSIDRKHDFSTRFLEDESGFSSMSSFQEIGIPIISIIPPSPCKEMGYKEDIPDIMEESEKWKTDTAELEQQTMKVFWV